MLDEARAVAERPRMRPSVAVLAVLGCIGWSGCCGRKNDSPPGRDTERTCNDRVSIYKGSIDVDAPDYVQHVMRGDDVVEEVIAGLDHVVSKAPRIDFTLDYPCRADCTELIRPRSATGVVRPDVRSRRSS
jgi:hypothetical protein